MIDEWRREARTAPHHSKIAAIGLGAKLDYVLGPISVIIGH
jgi:hypothetical protein